MKIKLEKIEFLKKLKILSKMPRGSKLSSKVSEEVFFNISNGDVQMMVYDGSEIFSVINLKDVEVECENEILFGMELKLLLSIVNKLEKSIEITVKEKIIEIVSGRTRIELYRRRLEEVWHGQDRPVMDDKIVQCSVKSIDLKNMINSVSVSSSEYKDNKSLSLIKFGISNGVIELSATDGYRASFAEKRIMEYEIMGDIEHLLDKKTIPIITEILNIGGKAEIIVSNKCIEFKVKDMSILIRCKPIDKYPNVKELLGYEGKRVISINKKEWSNAMQGIGNLGAKLIKIESMIDSDKVTLAGRSDYCDNQEIYGETDIIVEGDIKESIDMLFRNKLLFEGINSVSSEKIEVRLNGPTDFITIRPVDGIECVHVILPCRIR